MSVAADVWKPAPRSELEPRVPDRSNVALRTLPRHAARALVRGRTEEFDEVAWAMLTSTKLDSELDARASRLRRTLPFQDPDVFPPGTDLGPHARWLDYEQQESVVRLDDGAFVSRTGWVIRPPFHLVGRGLIRHHSGVARPNFGAYCRARAARSFVNRPSLLTLRDPAEGNYYHQITDVLASRLRLAEAAGVGPDIPLLVARSVYEHANFQYLLERTDLGDRTIVVQDSGTFVRADSVTIVQTPSFDKANFAYLQRWLSIPDGDLRANRRLFLVRNATSGRSFTNASAVEDLAKRFGFEIVAPETLPLAVQIELFSQARCVVGLWGSALFNVVWRRNAPLSMLEVFPPFMKNVDGYFFYLARSLGFAYSWFGEAVGEPYVVPTTFSEWRLHKQNKRASFEVDPDRLAPLIETMLDECG